jgi:GTP cyclohydrolase I
MDLTDDSIKAHLTVLLRCLLKKFLIESWKKAKASTFDNNYKYGEMLVEKNIIVYSTCEHHLLPIIGRAHVAYISNGRVIGLSKWIELLNIIQKTTGTRALDNANRSGITKCFGYKTLPALLTQNISVNSRGISDIESSTVTSEFVAKI